ncbi:MAG: M14 family metallopeptidase, partial [Bacteroidota bacterium]
LIYLTITSTENHAQLNDLQAKHLAVSDPDVSADINLDEVPLVLYQGYSIHGNEPSGGNAAVLVAYYLAAGQGAEIETLLDKTIILFDPCYNPDGFHRFSTWANMHKNLSMTADPQDREYDESWPRGRTNHYWFDLNRDWLPVQHPEGRGRVVTFHQWKPNVLTDHHEMGTNATFFFMPGEPTRVHPLTPWRNQELTEAIGDYHAEALDDIGSLYYSKEGYDDYYIGKGSTYPDVNGCIGILFEQASSRGHIQESDNGLLTFPFTIRNQVRTSLSTHAAVVGLKNDILGFQREFYQSARREAQADKRYGYVFSSDGDDSRAQHLIDILLVHQVEVYPLASEINADGNTYSPDDAYVVPLQQDQYRFIKAVFDPILEFEDSLFYDISTWTLPMACNLPYAELSSQPQLGRQLNTLPETSTANTQQSEYAYLLPWEDFYAPRLAYHLMSKGLRLKVTTEASVVDGKDYAAGTVFLPVVNQGSLSSDDIYRIVSEGVAATGVAMHGVQTGLSSAGPDLGSRKYRTLEIPKIAVIVGDGVTSYEAGTNWHLLDQRYHIPITKLASEDFRRANLDRYNVIIMPNGNYRWGKNEADKLREWVSAGGTLVAQKSANRWCASNKLAQLTPVEWPESETAERPYGKLSRDNGGRVLGGSIFNTEVDLTHPLLYGFAREELPVFQRGNLFYQPTTNPYATPIRFTEAPLLSGYVHPSSLEALSGSAALIVSGQGRGRTISMMQEPAFRAFWFGTSKLLANAVFFGTTISSGAREMVK